MIMSINLDAMEVSHNGYVRLGYQSYEGNAISENDLALGGKLNIELRNKNYFTLGASFYTANALSDIYNTGVPFYGSNNNSYTILGEAYLKVKIDKTKLIIGRQELDSPFANRDDIGMIPNTFEGVTLTYKDVDKRNKIVLAYLSKWSGVDSDVPQNFSDMNGDDGVYILGGAYGGFENIQLKAWFYAIPNIAKLGYFEANYDLNLGDLVLAFAGQYSVQDYESGETSNIYGASIEANYEPITLTLAHNRVNGVVANNFYGGGPFLTSLEHITVANGGDDALAWLMGASLDLSVVGVKNLTLGINHLNLQRKGLEDVHELDIALEYNCNDKLNAQLIYSDTEDKSFGDNSFENVRVFVNYNF